MRLDEQLAGKISKYVVRGTCDNPKAVLNMLRQARYDNIASKGGAEARLDVLGNDGNLYQVKPTSKRYQVFRRSLVCIACSKVGTHMVLIQHKQAFEEKVAHFGLFADDGTMMTQDHIIPVSKGGPNLIQNLQTMCERCNVHKSDKVTAEAVQRARQAGIFGFNLLCNAVIGQKRSNVIRFAMQEIIHGDEQRAKDYGFLDSVPTNVDIAELVLEIMDGSLRCGPKAEQFKAIAASLAAT